MSAMYLRMGPDLLDMFLFIKRRKKYLSELEDSFTMGMELERMQNETQTQAEEIVYEIKWRDFFCLPCKCS